MVEREHQDFGECVAFVSDSFVTWDEEGGLTLMSEALGCKQSQKEPPTAKPVWLPASV